jgi:site-specific recombinase XerD
VRVAGDTHYGLRTRALIVVLWRAGLRISEALALSETDLDRTRRSVLVRCGKGGKRRQVGMDRWAWNQMEPWLACRRYGRLFVRSPSRPASAGASPHTSYDTLTFVEMAREGVPLNVIQRQLGHANLGITSVLPAGH